MSQAASLRTLPRWSWRAWLGLAIALGSRRRRALHLADWPIDRGRVRGAQAAESNGHACRHRGSARRNRLVHAGIIGRDRTSSERTAREGAQGHGKHRTARPRHRRRRAGLVHRSTEAAYLSGVARWRHRFLRALDAGSQVGSPRRRGRRRRVVRRAQPHERDASQGRRGHSPRRRGACGKHSNRCGAVRHRHRSRRRSLGDAPERGQAVAHRRRRRRDRIRRADTKEADLGT